MLVDVVAAVVDGRAVVGGIVGGIVDLGSVEVDADAGAVVAVAAETVMSAQFLICSPQFACTGASGQVPHKAPHQDDAAQPSEAMLAK